MQTSFPAVLDSSLVAAFRSCARKAQLDFFLHWKPRSPSVHLHAGKAFARGLEVARQAFYIDGASPSDAIAEGLQALLLSYGDFECPPTSAKSASRTAGAYEYYFDQYPLDRDAAVPLPLPGGGRAIEFSFLEPLDIKHPETGDPLLYSGRFDMLTQYAGMLMGEDDKTVSQLGASWSRQWDLRSQFTGYCWGVARAGLRVEGFLVRGVSILKTKYETQQAITYRPQWMIDEWYEQLVDKDIPAMIAMWSSGKWGANLDYACAEYGGCAYRQVCLAEPSARDAWLESGFERRRWDPVSREETLL